MNKSGGSLRRFLLFDNGVIPGVINVLVNVILGWLSYDGLERIPKSGSNSVMADLLGTCFLLPFITVLIATPIVRRQPKMPAVVWPKQLRLLRPKSVFLRALVFGVCGLIILWPPVWFASDVYLDDAIALSRFAAIKLPFVFLLGVLLTPVIAFAALADRENAGR